MIRNMTARRGRALRRRLFVPIALVFGVLVVAACASASAATTPTPKKPKPAGTASYQTAPCPSPNYPGVPQLDLGPEFECGYLTVPEDRSAPHGPAIRIAVAIAKAASPDPARDPILYLAGGPGGTGLVTAPLRVADGWNRDRDVVFIDQRGTYHSDPLLACPEIDAFAASAVTFAASAPAAAGRSAAATRACHDRLLADGRNLSAFNTTENAADVADLRVALGIEKWNVYGVSYGTDLALQLLRRHPKGIRSLVLDSLVPPQLNLLQGFWPNAAEGYRAMFDACAAQPACASAYPDLESEFTAMVTELAAQPRTVTLADPAGGPDIDVVIDGYALANLAVVASLTPGSLAGVPSLIHDLATGGGAEAANAMLRGIPPPGVTGYGLTLGVFCGEQAAFTGLDQVVAEARSALPGFPSGVLSLVPQSAHIFSDCAAWDVGRADESVHAVTTSDVPVLLLAGTLDAITPPSWAEAATVGLSNSRTLLFPGAGHDVMIWSPGCAVDVMHSFLERPGPEFDDGCLDSVEVPPFRVP